MSHFFEVGPFDPVLPGPMKIRMNLKGDVIDSAEVNLGFLFKGLEKEAEKRKWKTVTPIISRLDPEESVYSELLFSLCVEQIAEFNVSDRATYVRLILCELNRISSHLKFLAIISRFSGCATSSYYFLREREFMLDLFELISGARFCYNYIVPGGLRYDVTEGFLERLSEGLEKVATKLPEYHNVLLNNIIFKKRLSQIGRISKEQAIYFGISGVNARASGVFTDERYGFYKNEYEKAGFESLVRNESEGADAYSRTYLRLKEIEQSVKLINQFVKFVGQGDFRDAKSTNIEIIPAGESFIKIESSRGTLSCHLVSNGNKKAQRVKIQTPSNPVMNYLPIYLKENEVEDLPLLLSSLDLSINEVDK